MSTPKPSGFSSPPTRGLTLVKCDRDAAAIGALFREASKSIVASVQRLIEVGHKLAAKKDSLEHGEWLPWLQANEATLGFDRKRAAGIMRAAVKCPVNGTFEENEARQISRQMWGNDGSRTAIWTGDFENYTPPDYIALVRKVLGEIDLDPASCALAQKIVKAKKFYTEANNGLEQEWRGRVFLNPPYNDQILRKFIDKLLEEIAAGRTKQAILLINNVADTDAGQLILHKCAVVCFPDGRVHFVKPDGKIVNPALGQMLSYFGPHTKKFIEVFSKIGVVVREAVA